MIVKKISDYYEQKALTEKRTGWPTGSRFGTCTAQLQFLRFPEHSTPMKPRPRDLIRWEHGRLVEEWLDRTLERVYPGLTGAKQEPFYFRVPLEADQVNFLQRRIEARKIWGTVREGFRPPRAEMVDGRIKLRLLPCDACTTQGRQHPWPCGKRLGFILDPSALAVWAPTYIDRLAKHDELGLVVVEGKALSNYGFRDLLTGNLDHERRCQLAGMAEATGLDVVAVALRKETQHLVDVAYTRTANTVRVAITRLNGQQEVFFAKNGAFVTEAGEAKELPGDAEWDVAETRTPYDPELVKAIQDRIRRVLLFEGDAKPGSRDVSREYGPDFTCQTCQGTGEQTRRKGQLDLLKKPKPCEECKQSGRLDEVELDYPCSWCAVIQTCYPFSTLTIDSKPHYQIRRIDWENSGLSFSNPTGGIR